MSKFQADNYLGYFINYDTIKSFLTEDNVPNQYSRLCEIAI